MTMRPREAQIRQDCYEDKRVESQEWKEIDLPQEFFRIVAGREDEVAEFLVPEASPAHSLLF